MKSVGWVELFIKILILPVATITSSAQHSEADTLNVAVASNFTSTLKLIQADFEIASGHNLQLISGSSGAHFAQIVNGAPFDLFLSADVERPEALEQAGLIGSKQRRVYALGRLALWSRDESLALDLNVLSEIDGSQQIALANPRLAPYGRAAEETLNYLGVYDLLKDQLVTGENVGQAFQFVFSGSAALGFIAYSQVLTAPVAGSYTIIPDVAYKPIAQEMVLLRPSAAGQALFDFLSSPAVTRILLESGYYAPTGDGSND